MSFDHELKIGLFVPKYPAPSSHIDSSGSFDINSGFIDRDMHQRFVDNIFSASPYKMGQRDSFTTWHPTSCLTGVSYK